MFSIIATAVVSGITLLCYKLIRNCFIVVRQQEVVFVERLGQLQSELGPGVHFLVPFIDCPKQLSWSSNEEVREGGRRPIVKHVRRTFTHIPVNRDRVFDFPEIEVVSKDKLPIFINGVLIYRIVDAKKVAYDVEDLTQSMELLLQTYMRDIASHSLLDEAIEGRADFQRQVKERLHNDEQRWGIRISSIDVQSVRCDASIQEANVQLIAEKRKAQALDEKVKADRAAKLSELETQRALKEQEYRMAAEEEDAALERRRRATLQQLEVEAKRNEAKRNEEMQQMKHSNEVNLMKRKAEADALLYQAEAESKKQRMLADTENYKRQKEIEAERNQLLAAAEGRSAYIKAELQAGLTEQYFIERERTQAFSAMINNANKIIVPADVSKYMGAAVLQETLQNTFNSALTEN